MHGGGALVPGAELAGADFGSPSSPTKWCIGTIDVPGSPSARGTASAFSHLATLMNASVFGVQDMLIPKYDCPEGVTCVAHDGLQAAFDERGCGVSVMHEWRSPIHLLEPATESPRPLVINVHGGLQFSNSWRNQSKFRPWVRYYVEDALEMAALHRADHVVFPSAWMSQWTCINQGFCKSERASVVANVMAAAAGEADTSLLQSVRRPVATFAYVGAVNDRKGIDTAVDAVCAHRVTLHVFGSLERLDETNVDAAQYLNEAQQRCAAKIVVYRAVIGSEFWPTLVAKQACLLNPSLLENQPTVVYEAALNQVPMLALGIGSVQEMVANLEEVTVESAEAFVEATRRIISEGEHATPALREQTLLGPTLWPDLMPTARDRDMVNVTRAFTLAPNASNADLSALLDGVDERFVLVLPSAEFSRAGLAALRVDAATADAFAPSLDLGPLSSSANRKALRVQPPFFLAEESAETAYIAFPRGAPFVANPADLRDFASDRPDDAFRAWAFGHRLYAAKRPVISLAQVGSTYAPACESSDADAGRMMRMKSMCAVAADPASQAGGELPLMDDSCGGTAVWQSTCVAGESVALN